MSTPVDLNDPRFFEYLRAQAAGLLIHPQLRAKYEPDDLVSEVYVRLGTAAEPFRGTTEAVAQCYLLMILRHVKADFDAGFLDAQCRDVRREVREEDLAGRGTAVDSAAVGLGNLLIADHTSPTQQAARRELLAWVETEINQLPEKEREVIRLKLCEGLKLNEIANRTGLTTAAVGSMIFRVIARLKAKKPET